MSTTRALARNTGIQAAGKIISTAIGVVIVGLMTRYLGQEGFGMYSTANAYFQIFAIILDFGLNIMLVQMLGERRGDAAFEDRAVSATFTFRFATAAVLLTVAPFLAFFFGYPPELKLALFAIWGSFFFTALNQVVIGVQQRHLKMHIVAIGEVAGRFTLLIGVFVAMAMHWGLVPIVLIVSLGGFINFLINALIAKRYASFAWNWDVAFWKILLKRSWPIGISIFFNLIYYKADVLILSHYRPFTEVGIYGAAYRVLDILISLPFMYAGVLLPILSTAWAKGEKARVQGLLRHSYEAMLIIIAPIVAGSLVLGNQMMHAVAGAAFDLSGSVLKILILAAGVIFLGTVSSHAVVTLDAQRRMMPAYILTAFVTLAGYLLFIPAYGMWAAAWLTVFSETCVAVAATVITLRDTRMKIRPGPYVKTIGASLLMALIIQPFKDAWLPIPIFAGAFVYGVVIIATGAVSHETLKDILAFRKGGPAADLT